MNAGRFLLELEGFADDVVELFRCFNGKTTNGDVGQTVVVEIAVPIIACQKFFVTEILNQATRNLRCGNNTGRVGVVPWNAASDEEQSGQGNLFGEKPNPLPDPLRGCNSPFAEGFDDDVNRPTLFGAVLDPRFQRPMIRRRRNNDNVIRRDEGRCPQQEEYYIT